MSSEKNDRVVYETIATVVCAFSEYPKLQGAIVRDQFLAYMAAYPDGRCEHIVDFTRKAPFKAKQFYDESVASYAQIIQYNLNHTGHC